MVYIVTGLKKEVMLESVAYFEGLKCKLLVCIRGSVAPWADPWVDSDVYEYLKSRSVWVITFLVSQKLLCVLSQFLGLCLRCSS